MNDFEDTKIFELFKRKDDQLFSLVNIYMKAFAIYLAINAAILKFAFDSDSTPELTKALLIFGVALSVLGVIVCIFGDFIRRKIITEMDNLAKILKLPELKSNYLPIKYTVIVGFAFVSFSLAAWIYISIQ